MARNQSGPISVSEKAKTREAEKDDIEQENIKVLRQKKHLIQHESGVQRVEIVNCGVDQVEENENQRDRKTALLPKSINSWRCRWSLGHIIK